MGFGLVGCVGLVGWVGSDPLAQVGLGFTCLVRSGLNHRVRSGLTHWVWVVSNLVHWVWFNLFGQVCSWVGLGLGFGLGGSGLIQGLGQF